MEHFDWRMSAELETPPTLFRSLNESFNFTLDAAASSQNTKCEKYFSRRENGLVQPWSGQRVFVHPPVDRDLRQWIAKAYSAVYQRRTTELVVMILPVRSDLVAWSLFVMHAAEVRFLEGRLFSDASAHFPRCVVVFNRCENPITQFSSIRLIENSSARSAARSPQQPHAVSPQRIGRGIFQKDMLNHEHA
jgi:site-specific DNA-methyltransferase (adenine-specific)